MNIIFYKKFFKPWKKTTKNIKIIFIWRVYVKLFYFKNKGLYL